MEEGLDVNKGCCDGRTPEEHASIDDGCCRMESLQIDALPADGQAAVRRGHAGIWS
jgi:hypothetical protein